MLQKLRGYVTADHKAQQIPENLDALDLKDAEDYDGGLYFLWKKVL